VSGHRRNGVIPVVGHPPPGFTRSATTRMSQQPRPCSWRRIDRSGGRSQWWEVLVESFTSRWWWNRILHLAQRPFIIRYFVDEIYYGFTHTSTHTLFLFVHYPGLHIPLAFLIFRLHQHRTWLLFHNKSQLNTVPLVSYMQIYTAANHQRRGCWCDSTYFNASSMVPVSSSVLASRRVYVNKYTALHSNYVMVDSVHESSTQPQIYSKYSIH